MHACDLVHLAAVIADQARAFIESGQPISLAALDEYWVASRCRLDRWGRALGNFTRLVHADPIQARHAWPGMRGVIEEILLSEILTRVWSATLYEHDRRLGHHECDAIVRSVMMGHLEARHRALLLLLHGSGVGTVAAVKLNQLRLKIERWIDLLVGSIVDDDKGVVQFSIDPERAAEFAADLHGHSQRPLARHAWQLTIASLKMAFRSRRKQDTGNSDLNHRVAQSITACFPPDLFDATGPLRSLWTVRLTNGTRDAQGLLDELLQLETASSDRGSRANQPSNGAVRFGGRG